MKRSIALFLGAFAVIGAGRVFAQDVPPGPSTVEVTAIPAGGTFFTSKNNAPSFGNYALGGALTYNINPVIGVEGEVSGSLGITEDMDFAGVTNHTRSPNFLNYSGNVVVSIPTASAFVPYATGGVGGLTMFERRSLGIDSTDTLLTGNVGGGVKWYAANSRWGLRGDYRFTYVWSKDDAPAFFGKDDRYGHRVYAGVIINVAR
jgi:opacity protein-like surface antigen